MGRAQPCLTPGAERALAAGTEARWWSGFWLSDPTPDPSQVTRSRTLVAKLQLVTTLSEPERDCTGGD